MDLLISFISSLYYFSKESIASSPCFYSIGIRSFFSIVSEKLFPDTHRTASLRRKIEPSSLNLPSDPSQAAEMIKKEGLDEGLPRLGQYSRLRVNIKESTELKVCRESIIMDLL